MIEKINNEKEMWANYYKNCDDNLIDQLLIDILAYLPSNEWDKRIDNCKEFVKANVKQSISKETLITSIESDLKTHNQIFDESAIVLRTLQWIENNLNENKE